MIRSFLKVILRNIRRKQLSTGINLFGMALAFAIAMAIHAYASHERSFDKYHANADRVYRVTYRFQNSSGYDIHWARMSQDWINELHVEFPEIERLVRFQSFRPRDVIVGEDKYREENAFAVDEEVFDVFDLQFLEGSPSAALTDPYSVVLTITTARRYFGNTSPIGKSIKISGDDGSKSDYTITGVIAELPPNTHLPITMLTSINNEQDRVGWAYVYLLLNDPVAIVGIESKSEDFVASKVDLEAGEELTLHFQPLTSIHLESQLSREIIPNGDKQNVLIFALVAIFLLVIGSVNFANLNTIQSMSRSKEIGLRKLLGGSIGNLRGYFFLEALMLGFISLSIGFALFMVGLPNLEQFLGHTLVYDPLIMVVGLVIVMALVVLLSSAIAGQLVVKAKLMDALKGQLTSSAHHGNMIKKVLVGIQFATVLLLIAASLIIQRQFAYMQDKKLGIDHDQVLALANNNRQVMKDYRMIKVELRQIPGVKDVSSIMQLPTSPIKDMGQVKVYDRPDLEVSADMQVMDVNAPELLNMSFVAGGPLPENLVRSEPVPESEIWNDFATKQRGYLVNETGARAMGWDNPSDAVGKRIDWSIGDLSLKEGYISGVIADYHQESLKAEIHPMVITYEPLWMPNILVKVDQGANERVRDQITNFWDDHFQDSPLEISYLDQKLEALYQSEQKQLQLISGFTMIAVIVALLGLSGMIAYGLKLRLKEMAIRRVLGSRTVEIAELLGREYMTVVLLAMIIAFPATWWLMSAWLDNYAYRINIDGLSLISAGSLLVSLLVSTAAYYAFSFQRINPASILKSE
ncbi:MAG: ABC transporter permease [Cyclobacteriaceae bacterium]